MPENFARRSNKPTARSAGPASRENVAGRHLIMEDRRLAFVIAHENPAAGTVVVAVTDRFILGVKKVDAAAAFQLSARPSGHAPKSFGKWHPIASSSAATLWTF